MNISSPIANIRNPLGEGTIPVWELENGGADGASDEEDELICDDDDGEDVKKEMR